MNRKSKLLVAVLSVATLASAGAASAQTRWERHHPRQEQVLNRDRHLRQEIRAERRAGDLRPGEAHRLLVRDRQIAREDHVMARAHGGHITRAERRDLNRQENHLHHRIHS